ncbi:MAG: hypothetical protein ABSH51_14060, partial [Solirubrobacteraceae bacterium]
LWRHRTRQAIRGVATGGALMLALAVSGCGGASTNDPSIHSTTAAASRTTAATSTAPSATTASAPALAVGSTSLPVATLGRDVDRLYDQHPQLASYVVQSTTYTTRCRHVVFHACTGGGRSATSEEIESSRLVACAPLIFYLYSYGTQRRSPQATAIADELFTFVSRDIRGPLDATSELAVLLRAWGIKVNTTGAPVVRSALTRTQEALLARIEQAILSKGSVRVTISGCQHNGNALVERIVADLGKGISRETITEPSAHAEIALTSRTALLSGDAGGLTKLLGLPSAAARRAGSRWIEVTKGSQEYADLEAEDTITALPSTILPSASNTVTLTRQSHSGAGPLEGVTRVPG